VSKIRFFKRGILERILEFDEALSKLVIKDGQGNVIKDLEEEVQVQQGIPVYDLLLYKDPDTNETVLADESGDEIARSPMLDSAVLNALSSVLSEGDVLAVKGHHVLSGLLSLESGVKLVGLGNATIEPDTVDDYIKLENVQDIQIVGIRLYSPTFTKLIDTVDTDKILIHRCTLDGDVYGSGLVITDSVLKSTVVVGNSVVSNSRLVDSDINIDGNRGGESIVIGNHLETTHKPAGIVVANDANNCLIALNVIKGYDSGIRLMEGSYILVIGNIIADCSTYGIYIDNHVGNSYVQKNLLVNCPTPISNLSSTTVLGADTSNDNMVV